MLYRTDLPIHSSPVLSRVLPIEHKHTKEPWLFLQSPLIQGLDLHSSTSARDKFKPQVLALSIRYGRHSDDIQYSHTAWVRMSHRPWQMSVSELKTYPLGHWQVKLPGVFLHWPFSHSCLFTTHSSISEGKHKRGKPVVLIAMPLYLGGHSLLCEVTQHTVDLPTQFLPVRSTSKPSLQAHLYVLSIFSHTPFWQMSGSRAHSFISEKT